MSDNRSPFSLDPAGGLSSVSSVSLSDPDRLEGLLAETELELARLQPEMDALQSQMQQLEQQWSEHQQRKQTLCALHRSLSQILGYAPLPETTTSADASVQSSPTTTDTQANTAPEAAAFSTANKTFLPDVAFEQANQILMRRDSLNYELFRAIVYRGGRATTEELKQFLIEHDIRQPTTGQSFENVPLTDISSRVNYLVRKGVVRTEGYGQFVASLGWESAS